MALPLLPGAGEGEGPHRVHRTRELRGPDDCGEPTAQSRLPASTGGTSGVETL